MQDNIQVDFIVSRPSVDDDTVDKFISNLSKSTDVSEMTVLVVKQPRPERLIKPSEKECRANLIMAYAVVLKAMATNVLPALASSIREAIPTIKCKTDKGTVLSGFYGYSDSGSMLTRDKGIIELMAFHKIEVNAADKFITDNGGLHKCYLRWVDEKRAHSNGDDPIDGEGPKPRPSVLRVSRPEWFEANGDTMVSIIRLVDTEKGRVELSHTVKIPQEIQSEFIRRLNLLLVTLSKNAEASPTSPARKGGAPTSLNKVAAPGTAPASKPSSGASPATAG